MEKSNKKNIKQPKNKKATLVIDGTHNTSNNAVNTKHYADDENTIINVATTMYSLLYNMFFRPAILGVNTTSTSTSTSTNTNTSNSTSIIGSNAKNETPQNNKQETLPRTHIGALELLSLTEEIIEGTRIEQFLNEITNQLFFLSKNAVTEIRRVHREKKREYSMQRGRLQEEQKRSTRKEQKTTKQTTDQVTSKVLNKIIHQTIKTLVTDQVKAEINIVSQRDELVKKLEEQGYQLMPREENELAMYQEILGLISEENSYQKHATKHMRNTGQEQDTNRRSLVFTRKLRRKKRGKEFFSWIHTKKAKLNILLLKPFIAFLSDTHVITMEHLVTYQVMATATILYSAKHNHKNKNKEHGENTGKKEKEKEENNEEKTSILATILGKHGNEETLETIYALYLLGLAIVIQGNPKKHKIHRTVSERLEYFMKNTPEEIARITRILSKKISNQGENFYVPTNQRRKQRINFEQIGVQAVEKIVIQDPLAKKDLEQQISPSELLLAYFLTNSYIGSLAIQAKEKGLLREKNTPNTNNTAIHVELFQDPRKTLQYMTQVFIDVTGKTRVNNKLLKTMPVVFHPVSIIRPTEKKERTIVFGSKTQPTNYIDILEQAIAKYRANTNNITNIEQVTNNEEILKNYHATTNYANTKTITKNNEVTIFVYTLNTNNTTSNKNTTQHTNTKNSLKNNEKQPSEPSPDKKTKQTLTPSPVKTTPTQLIRRTEKDFQQLEKIAISYEKILKETLAKNQYPKYFDPETHPFLKTIKTLANLLQETLAKTKNKNSPIRVET